MLKAYVSSCDTNSHPKSDWCLLASIVASWLGFDNSASSVECGTFSFSGSPSGNSDTSDANFLACSRNAAVATGSGHTTRTFGLSSSDSRKSVRSFSTSIQVQISGLNKHSSRSRD